MNVASVLLAVVAGAVPAANRVPARVPDTLTLADPADVRIEGFLGDRVDRNRSGRLMNVPLEDLLAGFENRPGTHPWIGEHIGKWLHAATLAWRYSDDPALKKRIDAAVRRLIAAQQPDGYLGTYADDQRWTSWDVWVHKYVLIGLLAYHGATGDPYALEAARRIGDLLVATFGPGKRDIIASGTHVGMAATSVLEPMVALYRATGEPRYLDFCRYLVASWDQPNGPRILTGLFRQGRVSRIANQKAYEMMSNLVGLCELYRVTGDERFRQAAEIAWDDINKTQCYSTGGTSYREHFQPELHLPVTGYVAETCANVTWMQLSLQLLALDGNPKYAEAIERLIYNHLLGAQADDGNDWCYFTVLYGRKRFRDDINCCHSSGPRGVALLPSAFYATADRTIRVNLYGPSEFRTELDGIGPVALSQNADFPAEGAIDIAVAPEQPAEFTVEFRIPSWSRRTSVAVNGRPVNVTAPLTRMTQMWHDGDRIALELDVAPQWIAGEFSRTTLWRARRGPFILCASPRWNPDLAPGDRIGVTDAMRLVAGADHTARVDAKVRTPSGIADRWITLGPFALVQHELFTVWMIDAERLATAPPISLFIGQASSYSRRGNRKGSIVDGDPNTYRNTYDGRRAAEDWYEVHCIGNETVTVERVVFQHGRTFHDGGWFDTSARKPSVLFTTHRGDDWKLLGTLDSYPDTTAEQAPRLPNGQAFELRIRPTTLHALRVVGVPACGDDPTQAFSSCAEIAAYGR
jgi:DUF1680 family protein